MNSMKVCFKVLVVNIACSPLGSGAPQQLNRTAGSRQGRRGVGFGVRRFWFKFWFLYSQFLMDSGLSASHLLNCRRKPLTFSLLSTGHTEHLVKAG